MALLLMWFALEGAFLLDVTRTPGALARTPSAAAPAGALTLARSSLQPCTP